MAVVWCRLTRSRQLAIRGKDDPTGERVYRVYCDAKTDGPDVAAAACPAKGTPWGEGVDEGTVVTGVDAKESADTPKVGTLYDVTLEYGTDPDDAGSDNPEKAENPTDRPLSVRLVFKSTEEQISQWVGDTPPTVEDADGGAISWPWSHGKAICNSTRQAFPEGLRETYYDIGFVVSKSVTTETFLTIAARLKAIVGTVNKTDVRIEYRGASYPIPAGKGLLCDPTTEPRLVTLKKTKDRPQPEDVEYEDLAFLIMFREDGWDQKVLDQGYMQASGTADDPSYNKPIPCTTAYNEQASNARPLDGKGKQLKEGGKPVFIKFPTKKRAEWSGLISLLA
ncbi:MAG: hypothetical protein JWO31_3637 [Phycisphaerales bacterium]|nr:hypothetical protein [Phycisphaerales bacterium]